MTFDINFQLIDSWDYSAPADYFQVYFDTHGFSSSTIISTFATSDYCGDGYKDVPNVHMIGISIKLESSLVLPVRSLTLFKMNSFSHYAQPDYNKSSGNQQ